MSAESRSKRDGDPREQYERVKLFLRRASRFWPTLLVVLGIGIVGCALFLILRQPAYRSETLILYTEGIRPMDTPGDPSRIGPRDAAVRLREMLMSRPRLQSTIREFGLYPDDLEKYGPMDAVERFREDIDFRAPGGDTFSIGFRGRSPEEAQAVTRHLADSLIAEEAGLRAKQAKAHREFLQAERKRTEAELGKAERAVAQFLADHPELAADVMLLMPGASSTGAAIRAASAEAAPAPAAPAAGGGGWRTVRVPAAGGGSAPASPAPTAAVDPDQRREIAAAKTRAEADLAAAQAALADKSSKFTELHPDVRALQARVARERSRVEAATAALAAMQTPRAAPAAGAPADTASRTIVRRVRVSAPSSSKDAPKVDEKEQKKALVDLETEWASLTRAAAEARAKNQQVEASLFKADLASKSEADGTGANMVVLDPAYRPSRPMPPGRLTVSAIFLALSLFLGVGIVAGRAAIDDRIYGAKDLERLGALLCEVPPLKINSRKMRLSR